MGIAWLVFCYFFYIGGNGYSIAAKETEKAQSISQILLVASANESNSGWATTTPTALDSTYLGSTSQSRFCISGTNQESHKRSHGECQRATTMALWCLLEAGQSQGSVLSKLWRMVGVGDGCKLQASGRIAERFLAMDEMARTIWNAVSPFEEEELVSKATQGCQRQREGQGADRHGTVTISGTRIGPSGTFSIPNTTNGILHFASSGSIWRSSRTRTHPCDQTCISRGKLDAIGIARDSGKERGHLQQVDYAGTSQSNCIAGSCPEKSTRTGGIKGSPQAAMDGPSSRVIGKLETANDFLRRATSPVRGTNCTSQSQCRCSSCHHSKSQCKSSRQSATGCGAVGTPERGSGLSPRSRRSSSSNQAAWNPGQSAPWS